MCLTPDSFPKSQPPKKQKVYRFITCSIYETCTSILEIILTLLRVLKNRKQADYPIYS